LGRCIWDARYISMRVHVVHLSLLLQRKYTGAQINLEANIIDMLVCKYILSPIYRVQIHLSALAYEYA